MEYITQKIVAPEGYEIDKDKCTLEEIVFRKKQPERVRKFDELREVSGCTRITHWPTREIGEAAVQLSRLMQMRQQWINGWVPDWTDVEQVKFCIYLDENQLENEALYSSNEILSFPTREMSADFLETFKSKLELAKPLL